MGNRRVRVIIRIFLGILILTASTTSCTLPLPAPRTLQAPSVTPTATAGPTLSPTDEPSDTPTALPTNTPVILVLPTHTPALATATATRVLDSTEYTTVTSEVETLPAISVTEPSTLTQATNTIVAQIVTLEPMPPVEPTLTATAESLATAVSTPPPTLMPVPSPDRKTTQATATAIATATATEVAAAPTKAPTVSAPPEVTTNELTYETGDAIANGGFEQGFDEFGVGKSWKGFDYVAGVYGWSDETWPGLTWNGQHAQMMRITFTSEPDQYLGIQQTVAVVKGESYELTLHGLIRSAEGSAQNSRWGYRIQWGIDPKGRDSWEVVQEWYDTGWDDQPLDATSYTINEYKATIIPTEDTLTLFIRGWRKWGTQDREVDFVIDGVSLVGPIPGNPPSNLPTTGASIPTVVWSGPLAAFGLVAVIFVLRQIRTRLSAGQ